MDSQGKKPIETARRPSREGIRNMEKEQDLPKSREDNRTKENEEEEKKQGADNKKQKGPCNPRLRLHPE